MTLRQLEVFVAVAQAQSFRRAAERLHTSQPALSQHVKELEAELDVRLLDRLRRSVHLTDAGRLLLDHAQRVFTTLGSAREVIGELKGLQRGSLLIGASTTPGIYVLPRVVGAFRQRHPNIRVTFRIANSRLIEDRIRANEFDLGVVGGHGLAPGERCLAVGLVDELVLIVGPRHPWAKRREIRPAELETAPLLVREEGSATREVTERALQRAQVAYRVAMELDHTEAIKQAVMVQLGVAFVSRYAIETEVAARRLHALRLRGVPVGRHFHVIHNEARALPPSAQAFLQALNEAGRPVERARPPGR
jgi:LysR family transcriptional regulator, low CO2-responsive transcriptional regulator